MFDLLIKLVPYRHFQCKVTLPFVIIILGGDSSKLCRHFPFKPFSLLVYLH